MCMFNTDAAYESEARGWLTRESAVKNYTIFKSTIAAHLGFNDSLMLQVCSSLLEFDYRFFDGSFVHNATPQQAGILDQARRLVKIDIDAILHVLCRKSLQSPKKAEELANTFRDGDEKVRQGAMICDAFASCVPEFKPYGVEEILELVPEVINEYGRLISLKKRYKKQAEKRFSLALRHLLWKKDYGLQHSEICPIPSEDCAFVQQFAYHDQQLSQTPMNAAWMPQHCPLMYGDVMMPLPYYPNPQPQHSMNGAVVPQFFPHSMNGAVVPQFFPHSMNGAVVPQFFPPMQSAAMYSACSPPIQMREKLDPFLEHLIVYVWKGIAPNLDPDAPDYVGYAYAEKQMDIADQLPKMLDRIGRRFQNLPSYETVACVRNVHVRLHAIKSSIDSMSPRQKAMIFAWAFVTELQGVQAFYDLGFFRDNSKNIDCLGKVYLMLHLPKYLYALPECTNIELYGECMRESVAHADHQTAKRSRCRDIEKAMKDNWGGFRAEWRRIMDRRFGADGNPMGDVFRHIFPHGDAPDAI